MRLRDLSLTDARALRENQELIPRFENLHRCLDRIDVADLAIHREGADLRDQPAEHLVSEQLLLCHRAENAFRMQRKDHPDRVGKRAVVAADDSRALRQIFPAVQAQHRVLQRKDHAQRPINKMVKLDGNLVSEKLNIKEYKVSYGKLEAVIYYEKEVTEEDILAKEKQIESLKASILKREKLLSNAGFVSKAPEQLVNDEKRKLEEEKKLLSTLE